MSVDILKEKWRVYETRHVGRHTSQEWAIDYMCERAIRVVHDQFWAPLDSVVSSFHIANILSFSRVQQSVSSSSVQIPIPNSDMF